MPHRNHESNNIHPTAILGNVRIEGYNVTIGPYCIVGHPPEDIEHLNAGKSSKPVVIMDGATLTGHVTVDAGTIKNTVIGTGAFLMKHSHVGHDAEIMHDVTVSCGAKIGGHTIVAPYSNIGLNAVIHQRHFIGAGAMVGMGSVVPLSRDVLPWSKVAGNPCKQIGDNLEYIKNKYGLYSTLIDYHNESYQNGGY